MIVSGARCPTFRQLETGNWQLETLQTKLSWLNLRKACLRRRAVWIRRCRLRGAFIIDQLQMHGAENDLAAELERQASFVGREPDDPFV
jgi:hypothetical protein